MAPPRTMVTLPNMDQIILVGGHPSVRVLVQLLSSRGYAVEVRLFPLNDLSLVPAADSPSLFFFCDALLTVCAPAVAPGVSAQISELGESSCDDSSAVNPDFPELGRRSW
jgi:hypothetical protein